MKIKKGDKVLVIKGKDRGKNGLVERVYPNLDRVLVAGLNLYKKHLKPSRRYPHGGIIDINLPISRSNVMTICPRCDKPTRISYKKAEKEKFRMCKRCKETVDAKA